MKLKKITVEYDEVKLAAIKQQLTAKDQSVEDELASHLDKLFETKVPAAIRSFIGFRSGSAPKKRERSVPTP